MQTLSVAFGRVTRATISANPELKAHVTDLLNRAYFNLHGTAITGADPLWVSAIMGAALQLCLDARVESLTVRELIHLFENIIRVSEEHIREARRHTAMASNVFYLKETALDALLGDEDADEFNTASTTIFSTSRAHSGRVDLVKLPESLI